MQGSNPLGPILITGSLIGISALAWAMLAIQPTVATLHLVFALGLLPLILAAMAYFTPTLTRTGPPPVAIIAIPLSALTAGIMAVFALGNDYGLLYGAAGIALASAIALLTWMGRRAKAALGTPHPGLLWYRLSLLCLVLALAAILTGLSLPQWWIPLRQAHLHLNLFGFVGLAAWGTLPVLLPTTAAFSDPQAALRLRSGWPWMLAGVFLLALGSVPPLAWLGGLLLLLMPARQMMVIFNHWPAIRTSGAALALAWATVGYLLLIPIGALHATGLPALPFYFFLFIAPLTSGAMTHLLPVWRFPGAQRPLQERMRRMIAWGSAPRLLLFTLAAVALATKHPWGSGMAALPLVAFLAQMVAALALVRKA